MTPEDEKKKALEAFYNVLPPFSPLHSSEVAAAQWEQIYQAFKQRMKSEEQ